MRRLVVEIGEQFKLHDRLRAGPSVTHRHSRSPSGSKSALRSAFSRRRVLTEHSGVFVHLVRGFRTLRGGVGVGGRVAAGVGPGFTSFGGWCLL